MDFFYAGARPEAILSGEKAGGLYLWVEKFPNHDGIHVCVKGDGRAVGENLMEMEF